MGNDPSLNTPSGGRKAMTKLYYIVEIMEPREGTFEIENLIDVLKWYKSVDIWLRTHDVVGEWRYSQLLVGCNYRIRKGLKFDGEFFTIRYLEEGEVFCSDRWTVQLRDDTLLAIPGDISAEMVAKFHGRIVVDLDMQLEQQIVDAVTDLVLQSESVDDSFCDFAEMLDLAYRLLKKADIYNLDSEDMELLTDELIRALLKENSSREIRSSTDSPAQP
jgi:hypothetical protein